MHVNELAVESIFIDDQEFYNENSRDSHNLREANTKIVTIMNSLLRKRSKAIFEQVSTGLNIIYIC